MWGKYFSAKGEETKRRGGYCCAQRQVQVCIDEMVEALLIDYLKRETMSPSNVTAFVDACV